MPIRLSRDSSGYDRLKSVKIFCGKPPAGIRGSGVNCLDIGLVNNMPCKALRATERQFVTLLDLAAHGVAVRLWLYALPDVPRTDLGRRHIDSFYFSIDDLWHHHLDGLIVTGMEPRAPRLIDEPQWTNLTKLIEWAEQNTHSTVWSCLAAHAAVFHMDGIARRRLSKKRFGLFECDRISQHQLLSSVPSRLVVPHSRWNAVPEDELTACGYRVLTRDRAGGVDMFVKQRQSLFVFFQGHPEYEANTLQLEYVRDVRRYLRRESDNYPALPNGYFDRDTAHALTELQTQALCDPRAELLAGIPNILSARHRANQWRSSAVRIYGNWLRVLCAAKAQRLGARRYCEPSAEQVVASAS